MNLRKDGRKHNELREIIIEPNYLKNAAGSALVCYGNTKVICTAQYESRVPQFLLNTGKGWISSEYSLLPGSTEIRTKREASSGKIKGRTHEIQRLIGRTLRTIVDLKKIGERTIWIDCDVIQADGGTRTASVTGSFIALALALKKLKDKGAIKKIPISDYIAAVSLGVRKDQVLLDLNYEEDSSCQVDMNIVMNGKGEFIELQGTGEQAGFSKEQLNEMIDLATNGINEILTVQKNIIETLVPELVL